MVLLHQHTFEFVPTTNKDSGWMIAEDGEPHLWWWAKFDDRQDGPIAVADGTDARGCAVLLGVRIGRATPDGKTVDQGIGKAAAESPPVPKWGRVAFRANGREVNVLVFISAENFDRVQRAVQSGQTPRLSVGFGPEDYDAELAGPITTDGQSGGYRWHTGQKNKSVIEIESCEFVFFRPAQESPVMPEPTPKGWRAVGMVWGVAVNLLAVFIAAAVLAAASTRFEAAAVSLLLLLYVAVSWSNRPLLEATGRLELDAITRFLALRALLGAPASAAENKYITHVREQIEKPGYRLVINSIGSSIIGVLALYRLATLLFEQARQ